MSYVTSHPLRCHLPPGRARHDPGLAHQMSAPARGATRTLPPTYQRAGTAAAPATSLAANGIRRHLPAPVSRAMTQAVIGGHPLPEGRPGSAMTDTQQDTVVADPTVAQSRASDIPVPALLKIVERTAIGISGQAGYAFAGAEPDGPGLRFGLLGLRLDTGDMGDMLRLALGRDAELSGLMGDAAPEILDRVLGTDPSARMRPMQDGKGLWDAPYKTLLSALGQHPAAKAAQNRFAVEALLIPAIDLLTRNEAPITGPLLAKTLSTIAALGREAGLAAVASAGAADTAAALLTACPACAEHFAALDRDAILANWTPGAA